MTRYVTTTVIVALSKRVFIAGLYETLELKMN